MFEVAPTIDYRGFQIQERRFKIYGTSVITLLDGSREGTEISQDENIQWAIVRPSANGTLEEEIDTAWSEEDARDRIDELMSKTK